MNTTLNATINQTLKDKAAEHIPELMGFLPLAFQRMGDLITAPFIHQEMLWILFHLILTLVVLEFYFDRHRDDELGWAAAVANSLVLFIISMDLLKHSFHGATPFEVLGIIGKSIFGSETLPLEPQVLILILFVGILGVVITIINYYHLLPKKIAFEVSGHPPINFLAFLAIVIVYTADTPEAIPLDMATLVGGFFLYIFILFIVFMVNRSLRGKVKEKKKHRF